MKLLIPLQPVKLSSMPGRREYDIAFVGLKPGIHEFLYEIDDKFFADYPEQDFSNVKTKVRLMLEKNSSFMMLKFEIGDHCHFLPLPATAIHKEIPFASCRRWVFAPFLLPQR